MSGRPWTGRCQRCREPAGVHVMSRFNLDLICLPCQERERAHPRYEEAAEAELAACRRGDLNFAGIGLPAELRP